MWAKGYDLVLLTLQNSPLLFNANKIFNIKGTLDTSTPLKISAISNMFNAVLDPILMFTFVLGVPGKI